MYTPLDTGDAGSLARVDFRRAAARGPRSDVLVFLEGESRGVRQPVAFQCCPLGVHFYSRRPVELYRLVEFTMAVPDASSGERHISCVGVVAGSAFDVGTSMYRICVKFLDVPEEARQQLEHFSRGAGLLCPYCENF